jgi:DsbC/DsbD-like thiol-disulfide interchange protein
MVLAVLTGAALILSPVQGGGQKSDSEVKATAKAEPPDANGKQTVHLTLTINKGWYIYANPVGNEDFAANATAVTVKPKPQAIEISYPAGKLKKDNLVGDYRIYENEVTIPIQVRRAPGDTAALELSVRVNACNTKMFCLPPGTIKVTVR